MHIALLTATDAPRYRSLMLVAYEQAADAFTSTVQERTIEPDAWWARRIADPHGLSVGFGAFEGDALVGAVALEFNAKPKTRHKALVIGMYVAPSSRGTGAGKALLRSAIGFARARPGVLMLTLTVIEGNEAAIGLYRSAGFEVFGTEPMAIRTPGGFRAKTHMWRALAADNTAA